MKYENGDISGVIIKKLEIFTDSRGYLMELYRKDWLEGTGYDLNPAMGYMSFTKSGVSRGPHEHREQTDIFVFVGPGTFRIWLWDARKKSKTYGNRFYIDGGTNDPILVIVPFGVVHGYKNISGNDGMVLNFPNRLYAGYNKMDAVDEIRHEDDVDGIFKME